MVPFLHVRQPCQPDSGECCPPRMHALIAGSALMLAGIFANVQAQTQAQAPAFRLDRVQIEGGSALAEHSWQAQLAPFLGREASLADIQAVRATIEKTYRDKGWRLTTVQVPEQTLSDGVLRLRVNEPRVRSVRIVGNQTFSLANWTASLPSLRAGLPPDLNELDQALGVLNEHAAKRAKVVFVAVPGSTRNEIDAEIHVEESPATSWTAFADNSGNAATGPLRYGLAWRTSNLWDMDHQLSVQAVSAPHEATDPDRISILPSDRVKILGIGYRWPMYGIGAVAEATLGHSSVDSGTLGGLFDVKGQGNTASLKVSKLMNRRSGWEPRWFVSLERKHFDSQILFGGANQATPISIHPVSIGLSATRRATPEHPVGYSAYLQTSGNLAGGTHGDTAAFNAARAGANANFHVLRSGASIQTDLEGWARGWGITALADAQFTDDLLVSGEQFSAGGASSVRGFSSRGISGDSGVRIQLEAIGPDWIGDAATGTSLRPVLFLDAAQAWLNQPTVLEVGRTSIASAGFGVRGALRNLVWRLDIARAFHQDTGAPAVWGGVHFSLSAVF